jgi:hypothetical protein
VHAPPTRRSSLAAAAAAASLLAVLLPPTAAPVTDAKTETAAPLALPKRLPASAGATFYVATNGSDSNPGTVARPWRTIQRAINGRRPGQRVLVRRGTYHENVRLERAGTASAPITLAAYPGERPIIDNESNPLEIDGSYYRIRGFVLQGARGTSSTNVYFETGAHHVELVGNEVRWSQDQGIFSEEESHDLHILGNRIHDNGRGHVSGQHQSHGLYFQGSNHVAANNVIYNHPYGFGIQVYDQNRGSIIVHNTVVASGHSGIVVGGGGGVSDITIRNNVLAFNSKYGVQTDSDCPTGGVLIDTNVIFGNRYGAIQRDCSSTVDSSAGNILANPRFAGLEARNLRLRSGSPAVDRARVDFAPPTDFAGLRRPHGRAPDIGAFELVR